MPDYDALAAQARTTAAPKAATEKPSGKVLDFDALAAQARRGKVQPDSAMRIGPDTSQPPIADESSPLGLASRALKFGAQSAISNIGGMGEAGREAVEHPISTLAATTAGYLAGPATKAVVEAVPGPVLKFGAKAALKALNWKAGAIAHILDLAGKLGTRAAPEAVEGATAAAEKAASARMVEGMGTAAKEGTEELVAAGKRAIAANPSATLTAAGSARTAGQMSPAWIQNDLALVARRANAALTPDQMHIAEGLVRDGGLSPVDAVLKVKAATKSMSAAADLMQRLGLPSDEEVARRVAERNATGRWQP